MNSRHMMLISTLVLMAMIGVAFSDLNQGLIVEKKMPMLLVAEPQEVFLSPELSTESIRSMLFGLLIVLIAVWAAEKRLNDVALQVYGARFRNVIIKMAKAIVHPGHAAAKRLIRGFDNMPKIDIPKMLRSIGYMAENVQNSCAKKARMMRKELKAAQKFFTKEFEQKDVEVYISLVMIIAVVGMGIYAVSPLNPGILAEPVIKQPLMITEPSINLSPVPVLDIFPVMLALMIVTIAAYLRSKKQ